MNTELLSHDLALFSDLGTEPPEIISEGGRFLVRMYRGGEELELAFADKAHGRVTERVIDTGAERTHASYRALLASETFGNLRKWAASQGAFLKEKEKDLPRLKVYGTLPDQEDQIHPAQLDSLLMETAHSLGSVHVMLIDGPAGIGKTMFIEELSLRRATSFATQQRPLILHVESRGRVLTFLQDLIAFSLQQMRLPVTFDQLPILVRTGLVTLAIDGFDELGDPSGYEHAWGQLNDLIEQVRGKGTVILAGRDTFIGPERILADIKALKSEDVVRALSLQPPSPAHATAWLRENGWQDRDLQSVEELLEPGSYALRPFFLAQMSLPENARLMKDMTAGTPLAFLVDLMVTREAGKFGEAVDKVMELPVRLGFIRRYLRELARFMADDQTEAIDTIAMTWLVDVAAPEGTGQQTLNLLKNRAMVMAFLTKDQAHNHFRFSHSQLLHQFLSEETFDVVPRNEVPKYLRRNILAAEFLTAFSDLAIHYSQIDTQRDRIPAFFRSASDLASSYTTLDRGGRNLGALLLTVLPLMDDTEDHLRLGPLQIDEASLRDCTLPSAELDMLVVNQLDVRGADLRALRFVKTTILSVIADGATRLSETFPTPSRVRHDADGTQRTLTEPQEIDDWMTGRLPPSELDSSQQLHRYSEHPLSRLLERACRSRAYWIREDSTDPITAKLVKSPHWPTLLLLLQQHDLLRRENRPSGGQKADFVHIKRPMELLRNHGDQQIHRFHEALQVAINQA